MRQITTCKQCGKTVTQHHYSGHVAYCSDACRKPVEQQQNRERLQRFRKKKKLVSQDGVEWHTQLVPFHFEQHKRRITLARSQCAALVA